MSHEVGMSHEGGGEDVAKLSYEKPELRHLGLLRELTKMSGWNDGGAWNGGGDWHDWNGMDSSGHHRWWWW